MGLQITAETADPQVEVYADRPEVTRLVAGKLLRVLAETVEAAGAAHIARTGGGAGIATLEEVAGLGRDGASDDLDWTRVHFWWGDERLLPERDAERNQVQASAALLDFLVAEHRLPAENIHPMPTSEQAADPAAGASIYAQELERFAPEGGIPGRHGQLNMPLFAVMLLGVGPDGHINSLFPGRDSLKVTGRTTTGEEDSPKPPPLRVTLTFDALQTAERVWLVATGEDKAQAAAGALSAAADPQTYPAAYARGAGETVWHLDQSAASQL